MIYAVKSGLKEEVAGSYLNWIWWVLEPFCFMLIYAVIFGVIFKSSEQYFAIFIFTGNAMWSFFSRCTSASVSLVKKNETIIARIYVPKFILLLIEMGINAFKMMLNFVIILVMLAFFRVELSFNILFAIPALALLFVITFAVSTFFMHWGVYVEDLSYVVAILLNMLMYFTGIFYSIENRLDYPYGMMLSTFNPIAFTITSMRKAIMYATTPDLRSMLVWFVIGILVSILGVKVLYKNENDYVKVI